jgi:hypothetical protein
MYVFYVFPQRVYFVARCGTEIRWGARTVQNNRSGPHMMSGQGM